MNDKTKPDVEPVDPPDHQGGNNPDPEDPADWPQTDPPEGNTIGSDI